MRIYVIDGHASVFNSLIACKVLVVIATISVSLRVWARRGRKVSLWVSSTVPIGVNVLVCKTNLHLFSMV